jgi:hypothetical protein
MKKITLFICTLMLGAATFAQTLICPSSFKRSNGAGGGCDNGKITLIFTQCPAFPPTIDSVYSDGVKLNVTFAAGVLDCSSSRKEVTYCIIGGNVPPTNTMTVFFQASGVYNGTTCVIPPSGAPLPVTLSSFTAARNTTGSVHLRWETSMELNAAAFTIQKKINGVFVDVATVKAANLAGGSKYSHTDADASRNGIEYRLKSTDLDGSFTQSEIRTVKGMDVSMEVKIYPVPTRNNATVLLSETYEKAVVQVTDNSGRTIRTIDLVKSNSTILKNLIPGVYIVKVTDVSTGASVSKKLVVTP